MGGGSPDYSASYVIGPDIALIIEGHDLQLNSGRRRPPPSLRIEGAYIYI